MFWKISENIQKKACVGVSFLMKLEAFFFFQKNTKLQNFSESRFLIEQPWMLLFFWLSWMLAKHLHKVCAETSLIHFSLKAVVWRCSVEKLLLEISQNSQENTYARVSFFIKLQAFSKNTFFYRTPQVATSPVSHHLDFWKTAVSCKV